MKSIGLTLRVEEVPGHGERRDCLDQRWALLLQQAACLPVPLMNLTADADACLASLDLAGVILTGGNDLACLPEGSNPAPERDDFEAALIRACAARRLPVLGVCRGAQMLAVHYGARLEPIEGHVGASTSIRTEALLREAYPQGLRVTCYHGYAVDEASLPGDLEVLARSADGALEAVGHRALPQWGLMWHPEREDPFRPEDIALLRRVFGELP